MDVVMLQMTNEAKAPVSPRSQSRETLFALPDTPVGTAGLRLSSEAPFIERGHEVRILEILIFLSSYIFRYKINIFVL